MRTITQQQTGFSLIEAIIYIALFSLIITTGVLTAFQVFRGQENIQIATKRESELNFLLRKLDWLANGEINGVTSGELTATTDTQYRIRRSGDAVELIRTIDSKTSTITNDYLPVSNLSFTLTAGSPDILTIELTANGETFDTITHYVRTN